MEFVIFLDGLVEKYNSLKGNIVRFLTRNFIENIHYIKILPNKPNNSLGRTKILYMLTQNTYDLIHDTYNRRNRYITESATNVQHINLLMSLEQQSIGFITKCFDNIYPFIRQFHIGQYKVDLCFTSLKLVIECDENGHEDRNINLEKRREDFIISQGYTMIRFNPNDKKFELYDVINSIHQYIRTLNST